MSNNHSKIFFLIIMAVEIFTLIVWNVFSIFPNFEQPYQDSILQSIEEVTSSLEKTSDSRGRVAVFVKYIPEITEKVKSTVDDTFQTTEKVRACEIPRLDPFDASIMPYIKKLDPLKCKTFQPRLTSLDSDGVLRVNKKSMEYLKFRTRRGVHCTYSDIWLADDNNLQYGTPRVLKKTHVITSDTCVVKCTSNITGTVFYENVHIYAKSPKAVPPSRIPGTKPSIFLLAIDSMSHPNFIRQLPKTYNYLTTTLGATVLKGLNKVGLNTFPNIVPLLTGLKVSNDPYEPHDFLAPRYKFRKMNMDNMPLLWRAFRSYGYLTLYAEDFPIAPLFNFVTKGFKEPPVDYYMRPFWMATRNTTTEKKSSWYCFGRDARHNLILRYADQFIRRNKDVPYFAFPFISEISPDEINTVQMIDDDVHAFLRRSVDDHLLDDAILIVMGDHGNRYGKYRETTLGRFEERMPFFSIRLPKWLRVKHPHLTLNLEINSERLTTWFDVHEMLVDVYLDDLGDGESSSVWRPPSPHGISLFRQLVPLNRTCQDACIPLEYCICTVEESVPVDAPEVVSAADALVQHVNKLLGPIETQCYHLELKKLTQANIMKFSWASSETDLKSNKEVHLRLVVETKPNDALLEAMMLKGSKTFEVLGDVTRINKYGNQSSCIQDPVLRQYCLCKDS